MNTMHLLSYLPMLHTTPPGTTTGQQNNQQTNRNKQTSTPHIHTYPPSFINDHLITIPSIYPKRQMQKLLSFIKNRLIERQFTAKQHIQ